MLSDSTKIATSERDIVIGTYNYYCIEGATPGVLPDFTVACTVKTLAPYVISETVTERSYDQDYAAPRLGKN